MLNLIMIAMWLVLGVLGFAPRAATDLEIRPGNKE